MYDIMREAEEKLVKVGTDLTTSVIFFVFSIFVVSIIAFIVLNIINSKRPQEKKISEIMIFLMAFLIGWGITTLVFVYRVVIVGLLKLTSG